MEEYNQKQLSKKHLWSACLGNLFEHYDTALFGFLSVFLAPLIFPEKDPVTALVLTYAMIPLGMLARPLGALVFGYIGDRYGRKQALVLSLGGMSLVSGCIACTPTFVQIGVFAPILFGLGRVLQNFLAAGETMGGAIFLLENMPEKKHDLFSGLYNSTTIGGILFASAGVSLIAYYGVTDWGWRLLYFIGCLTGLFAFLIRSQLPASAWNVSTAQKRESFTSLMKMFWTHRKPLAMIAIGSGFAYANYSMALVLLNGFIPMVSSVTKVEMMSLNTLLLVIDFLALPFFGWLSSKISREKVMLGATLAVVLTGIPLFTLLPTASLAGLFFIRMFFVFYGVAYFAPFHAWAQQIVPPACRYGIISFGYAIGSQLLGGPTAALSLWAYQQTGMVVSVAWYWMLLALFTTVTLVLVTKSQQKSVAITG